MLEKKQDALESMDDIDLLVVPSCSTVTNGKLCMTSGVSRRIAKMWEGIDSYFGKYIDDVCGNNGLFWYARHPSLPIGLIQVKTKSSLRPIPKLASDSLYHIRYIAEAYPDMKIGLVISQDVVDKIGRDELYSMPDNVVRYK